MPIVARIPAARTSGMPWSMQAGMRWVAMRPFVLAPQTKKVPARSQKSREREARASVRNASTAGLPGRRVMTGSPSDAP